MPKMSYTPITAYVMSRLSLDGMKVAIGTFDIGIYEEAIEEGHTKDQGLLL